MALLKAGRAEGGTKELLSLAWPFIISNSVWTLQMLIDRVMLSRYGVDEVGAAIAAGVFFWVIISLTQGTAGYVTTFVAQYVGAGQPRRVGPIMWQAIYFSIFAGVLMLALVPLADAIAALGEHEAHIQVLEATFLRCQAFAVLPMALTASTCGFFAGRGRSRTVLFINVSGMLVYFALAPLLIFGTKRLGIPDWPSEIPPLGIAGAAWSSVAGAWVSAVLGLGLMFLPRFEEEHATLSGWRLDPRLFGRLMRFGLPNGLGAALDAIVFTFFIAFIGRISPAALSATSITFTLNMIVILPALGIGQAIEVLVGRRLGEDRPDVAARSAWTGLRLTVAFTAVMALSCLLFPGPLVELFGTAEAMGGERAEVARIVPVLLRFVLVYCLFDTMNVTFSFALRGAGDTRFVTLVALVFAWPTMVVPTWLVVTYGWGLYWAWTFAALYIIALALTYLFRFLQGRWRSMRVIEVAVVDAPVPAETGFIAARPTAFAEEVRGG
jgi:MATE family multidrug resistance protein